ncbi:hypothetical protein B566_EDAN010965 [Ephemera danica]|nr:hypothetical protein B566_EDAN010965 [Ephemera danica]
MTFLTAMFQAPVLPGLPPPTSGVQSGGSPVFPSSASSASSSSSLHEPPSSAARGTGSLASQQPLPLPPPPISHSPAPPAVHQISLMSRPSPPTAAANGGALSGTSSGSRHGSPSPGPCPPLQAGPGSCPPLQAGPGSSHGGSSGGAPSPGLPLHVHGADSMSPGSPPPLQLTPSLSEPQIARLAESARLLAAALPSLEPKPQNSKKRICKDLEVTHVSVNEAAAQICRLVPALLTRRDELFPLARQVVRDSGYQYSKAHSSESGHSLGCPSGYSRPHNGEETGSVGSSVKRMRLFDPSDPHADLRRQDRLEQISEELRAVAERQEELRRLTTGTNSAASSEAAWHTQLEALAARQAQLAGEQAELGRSSARQSHNSSSRGFRRSARISAASFTDTEQRGDATTTANSSKSPNKVSKQLVQETLLGEGLRVVKELVASQAGEEPPPAHLSHAVAARGLLHHYDAFFHHENKVISASGGNIIAVANPALSMSPAMLQGNDPTAEMKGQCSPRPHSAAATSHPITSLLQGLGAQFKQEPLSPCKSE